jgi:NADH:ubiquinone oxidoreductase subunit E
MPETPPASIVICMGSSCFARGNNRNIEVIQDYLRSHRPPPAVELTGHLCQGHCQAGPNVRINGGQYHEVDPIGIISLLNHLLPREPG